MMVMKARSVMPSPFLPSWVSPSSGSFHNHRPPIYCSIPSIRDGLGSAFVLPTHISAFKRQQTWSPTPFVHTKRIVMRESQRKKHESIVCNCSSSERKVGDESNSFGDRLKRWVELNRTQEPVGERVVKMLAGATAAPTAQYIASPSTALHSLDPRVKQAWLLVLVVLPSRSPMIFRVGTVACLALTTMLSLPQHIWKDQLGRMLLLSGVLFVMLAFGTDGLAPLVQTRTPPPALESLPGLPNALGGYSYVIAKLGPLQLTRKGLSLATTASCLSFTVLQSASLCLTTTTPEQLSAALRWYLLPLLYIGAPVDEMILTLLLSLRFVSLVFDEARNLSLSVVSRRVQWKALKLFETLDLFAMLMGRFFKNLLYHAEQITQAMVARGFKGDASRHRLYLLTTLRLKRQDILAIAALAVLIAVSIISEIYLT
ncbi:hypothetical protein O6H91_18G018300 [Diphasiastrum complanatum]|uniref:Uncharacterized protein n=1 Tax=Diphasiastrum complanatum TaxID=34168 RepID=A0ACC2AYH7_DIPCM|nr:hypothetical protein O6H91_18G018300 [Diphasiastrum complanatum]